MHDREADWSDREVGAAIVGGIGLLCVGVALNHFFGWAAVVLLIGVLLTAAAIVA